MNDLVRRVSTAFIAGYTALTLAGVVGCVDKPEDLCAANVTRAEAGVEVKLDDNDLGDSAKGIEYTVVLDHLMYEPDDGTASGAEKIYAVFSQFGREENLELSIANYDGESHSDDTPEWSYSYNSFDYNGNLCEGMFCDDEETAWILAQSSQDEVNMPVVAGYDTPEDVSDDYIDLKLGVSLTDCNSDCNEWMTKDEYVCDGYGTI